MESLEQLGRPTKSEQKAAIASYSALESVIHQLKSEETEIEIEEPRKSITIPVRALKLLSDVLKAMSKGESISIIPLATEVTTQKAAEILGCSRPFLVKLLEEGKTPFTKVGKHRRSRMEDVLKYKQKMKAEQKKHIIDIMNEDEETRLYDS